MDMELSLVIGPSFYHGTLLSFYLPRRGVCGRGNERRWRRTVGLLNLSFPDMVQLLEYLWIWIGDTAATVHITPHVVGMVPNQDDRLRGQTITIGNGKLNNVANSPQMKYNLCSLSRLMEDGWKIKGDNKGIVMVKKENKLVLDIIIMMETSLVMNLLAPPSHAEGHGVSTSYGTWGKMWPMR